MGVMKEFAMWMEEKGYAEWNDLLDWYDYHRDPNDPAVWDEYMSERKTNVEEVQMDLFDDEEDFLPDDETDSDVVVDDGDYDSPFLPRAFMNAPYDDDEETLPLFDENGGLTAEAYNLLYELEQDGGFT